MHPVLYFFGGKLGIWLLVEEGVAIRSSKNRLRGARILKNIDSIDREVYRRYLLDEDFPIRKPGTKKVIYVQQDNAKPHIDPNDPEILRAGREEHFEIRLRNQPAHSPDLNVLDLGLRYRTGCVLG